ncbi:hypothetical protein M670_03569 [Schinkia azotoformans MEV2011]|uniref:Uncharacterized protein n=1 Tax=Schinkia azotoformans MEV2011 TaxID=1348973 RepID=A0A072NV91_SCHAZ|nr:hypothetical protein M670_03569 [Schinkia azotoformans MEV2011]
MQDWNALRTLLTAFEHNEPDDVMSILDMEP